LTTLTIARESRTMREESGSTWSPLRVRALAWSLIPAPMIGWALAQLLPLRIAHTADFTSAMVHQWATSIFAFVFLGSAIVNSLIVSRRAPNRPSAYRSTGYALWQAILLALSIGWIACIAIGEPAITVEFFLGIAIAVDSIVVCVWAALPDRRSADRRRLRAEQRRHARAEPPVRRRARRVRFVAAAVVLAAVAIVVTTQLVPIRYSGCEITGSFFSSAGGDSISTTCGEFGLDPGIRASEVGRAGTVDITARGWGIALASGVFAPVIRPIAVSLDSSGASEAG
jgi:hypothetical protein